jgi:HEAT repeat protein
MVVNELPVNELIAALGADDDEIRRNAQITLHECGVMVIEPLGAALLTGDPLVRRRAAALLADVGDARAVTPLIRALNALQCEECDDLTLVKIVDALGHFGDPRGVKALTEALPGATPQVQRRIIAALVNIGDRRAIEPIQRLVDDPTVGETARWALYQLGD